MIFRNNNNNLIYKYKIIIINLTNHIQKIRLNNFRILENLLFQYMYSDFKNKIIIHIFI